MKLKNQEIKALLDGAYRAYCHPGFIPEDPVSVPRRFTKREDIEIAGFFAALFAWGKRSIILQKTNLLMKLMDDDPHAFILSFREQDLNGLKHFVHRTFQFDDLHFFLLRLQHIYNEYGSLEKLFLPADDLEEGIHHFRNVFFDAPHFTRTCKHLPDPKKNSACKRINLFLRWMVRTDAEGVDFGLWKDIQPASLYCPLDVHTGRAAEKLGLIPKGMTGWKAVRHLTGKLRHFDPQDPVKYDFALFGLNIYQSYILPLTDRNRPLT